MSTETLSLTEKQDLKLEMYLDPVLFCRTMFPNLFWRPVPWFHRGMLAILTRKTDFLLKYGELDKIFKHFVFKTDPGDKKAPEFPIFSLDSSGNIVMAIGDYVLEKWPRGYSKTTIANAYLLYGANYKEFDFCLYLSESTSHSKSQLHMIKTELETNTRLIEIFGDQVPARNEPERWGQNLIELKNGVIIKVGSRDTQTRGQNEGGLRPDLILGDDIEDEESVATPEQRDKAKTWFYGAVMPALSQKPGSRIILMGTRLHREALLQTIEKDPSWTTVVFACVDKDGDPLWPEEKPLSSIEEKRRSFAIAGKLEQFYLEFFNEDRNEETAKFKFQWIRVVDDPVTNYPYRALALDPALSDKRTADAAAFGVVGMAKDGRKMVLDISGRRGMSVREIVDELFRLYALWRPMRVGIEANGLGKGLFYPVETAMHAKGLFFEVVPILSPPTNKKQRIVSILQPQYASGYITHRAEFPELVSELLDHPRGHDDFADVESMCVQMLDPRLAESVAPTELLALAEEVESSTADWRSAP